jgi:hypothetical protein
MQEVNNAIFNVNIPLFGVIVITALQKIKNLRYCLSREAFPFSLYLGNDAYMMMAYVDSRNT